MSGLFHWPLHWWRRLLDRSELWDSPGGQRSRIWGCGVCMTRDYLKYQGMDSGAGNGPYESTATTGANR